MVLFDDFDDCRAGDRAGGPGLQRGLYLLGFGDAETLQRRRGVILAQLVHQVMQRQLRSAFGAGHPGARQQVGVAAAV